MTKEINIRHRNKAIKFKRNKRIKNLEKRNKINNIYTIDNITKSNLDENISNTQNKSLEDNFNNLEEKNLSKINLNSNNTNESLTDSIESNFISVKAQKVAFNRYLAEGICSNLDEENSFSEDEDEIKELEGKNIENYKKELTNNIKSIFVDSKIIRKDSNSNISDQSTLSFSLTSSSTNSITSIMESLDYDFDYELNFYRNGDDIRQSYLAKLITKKIWNPINKEKKFNSLFIFDWDDTLLPTSFLSPGGYFNPNIELSKEDTLKLLKIEKKVLELLTNSIEKGEVYIITNARKDWVEFSARRFYPKIIDILPKIRIISAREEYENIFPNDLRKWKMQSFLDLQKFVNVKLVTNLICFGDSSLEIEAGRFLGSKFKEAFIKTIKFKEIPKLDDLQKQLNAVCDKFNYIYSSIRNLTIKVEKKKN